MFSRLFNLPIIFLISFCLLPIAQGKSRVLKSSDASSTHFKPEWLIPYLNKGPVSRARAAIEIRDWSQAAQLLRQYLKNQQHSRAQVPAQFLLAYALLSAPYSEGWKESTRLFSTLAEKYPLLRDYCHFFSARAFLNLRQYTQAESQASSVEEHSVLKPQAQLLRAEALYALSQKQASAAIWQAYLEQQPHGAQVGKAYFRIAEAAEEAALTKGGAEKTTLQAKAYQAYQLATLKAPLSTWRSESEKRMAILSRTLPDALRQPPSLWQRFEQAHVYFRAMRNSESEQAFAALLKEKNADLMLRCKSTYYLAYSIFKQRQRGRAAAYYQAAARLCREVEESNLVVKSLFNGAKGLMNSKQYLEAIQQFAAIEKEYPQHSYADDARLWAAEAYDNLNQPDDVVRLLNDLPDRYPEGDMAHEALWRLARMAYQNQRYDDALKYLDRSLNKLGPPRYYYAQGQALYWKARILSQQGNAAEAAKYYEQCIRDYPLSYYALLAFNRLRRQHKPLFKKLYTEILGTVGKNQWQWSFSKNNLFQETGFLRGVELVRLGLGEWAAKEFARVGLSANASTEPNLLWLAAVLYDRAELWHLSHQVPRSIDLSYKTSYPLGENYRRWSIAYPQAFAPYVYYAARLTKLPDALIYAIMREESGFTPTVESYANALGLMQLILPTAKKAGKTQNLEVTRAMLFDPKNNIKLGATYLNFLYHKFNQTIPLVIAGYNAGEGAVGRWLRQFGTVPLDEFIERIPYDQTRRYTKRVLSTLFVYSVLYKNKRERIPLLELDVPKHAPRK